MQDIQSGRGDHVVKIGKRKKLYNNEPYMKMVAMEGLATDRTNSDINQHHIMQQTAENNDVQNMSKQTDRSYENISRLDELLSRNDKIYRNLRERLEEISKSNKKIDENINNIKPYSGSHREMHPSQSFIITQPNSNVIQLTNSRESIAPYFPIQSNLHHKQEEIKTMQSRNRNYSKNKSNQKINNLSSQEFSIGNQKFLMMQQNHNKSSTIEEEYHICPQKVNKPQPQYLNIISNNFNTNQIQQQENIFKEKVPIHQLSPRKLKDLIKQEGKQKGLEYHYSQMSPYLQKQVNTSPYVEDTFQKNAEDMQQNWESKISEKSQSNKIKEKPNLSKGKIRNLSPSNLKHSQYSQSPSQMKVKNFTHNSKQSITFIPFNKLYSSPVLQLSRNNQVIVSRAEKTTKFAKTHGKVLNGIKYRFPKQCLILQQIKIYETFLKCLQENGMKNPFTWGIVGRVNCLKKKLHIGILAHLYDKVLNILSDISDSQKEKIIVQLEHQETATNANPVIHSYCGTLSTNDVENKILLENIEALFEKIFIGMKENLVGQNHHQQPSHRIRLTHFQLINYGLDVKIMSTNKTSLDFIESLGFSHILWCINPLYRHHSQTLKTLVNESAFRSHIQQESVKTNNTNRSLSLLSRSRK